MLGFGETRTRYSRLFVTLTVFFFCWYYVYWNTDMSIQFFNNCYVDFFWNVNLYKYIYSLPNITSVSSLLIYDVKPYSHTSITFCQFLDSQIGGYIMRLVCLFVCESDYQSVRNAITPMMIYYLPFKYAYQMMKRQQSIYMMTMKMDLVKRINLRTNSCGINICD